MKVLVMSDSHGNWRNIEGVLELVGDIDMLIHCGDVENDEDYIRAAVDCPVHIVAGNCDYSYDLPSADIFEVGNYKVMACHGHGFFVNGGTKYLKEYAKDNGIDVVMYGHTHRPDLEIDEDVTVLNPGSVSFPRQEDRQKTYLIMEIDEAGKAHYTHYVYDPSAVI